MSYVVRRVEKDGTTLVVGCTDDQAMTGCIMDEDRKGIDYDVEYTVTKE